MKIGDFNNCLTIEQARQKYGDFSRLRLEEFDEKEGFHLYNIFHPSGRLYSKCLLIERQEYEALGGPSRITGKEISRLLYGESAE